MFTGRTVVIVAALLYLPGYVKSEDSVSINCINFRRKVSLLFPKKVETLSKNDEEITKALDTGKTNFLKEVSIEKSIKGMTDAMKEKAKHAASKKAGTFLDDTQAQLEKAQSIEVALSGIELKVNNFKKHLITETNEARARIDEIINTNQRGFFSQQLYTTAKEHDLNEKEVAVAPADEEGPADSTSEKNMTNLPLAQPPQIETPKLEVPSFPSIG